jgi:hypothetical protein
VRHVRMLRLALAVVFAMSALTLNFASSAIAKKSPWAKFEQCPFGAKVVTPQGEKGPQFCFFGEAGKESFFQAGKVTVHFVKPIDLRGALAEYEENGERINPFIAPRNNELITKEAEPGPSLTEGIDAEKLEEPEKKRYEEYVAAGKSTKTTETIELAKPNIFVSLRKFFSEVGPSFSFSVLIHIQNPFLGKTCLDGSTVTPIEVPFTTGETAPPPPNTPIRGAIGAEFEEEELIDGAEATLVDNEYAAPGVTGCGVNGGADAALNAGLGLPSPAGSNTTELIGRLYVASAKRTEEHIHL